MLQYIKAFLAGSVSVAVVFVLGVLGLAAISEWFGRSGERAIDFFAPAVACFAAAIGAAVATKVIEYKSMVPAVALGAVFGVIVFLNVKDAVEVPLIYRIASGLFSLLPAVVVGRVSMTGLPSDSKGRLRISNSHKILLVLVLVVLPVISYPYAKMFPDPRLKTASKVGDIDLSLAREAGSFATVKQILKEEPELYEQKYKVVNYRKADFANGLINVGVLLEGNVADKIIDITVKPPFMGSIEGMRLGQTLEQATAAVAARGYKVERSEFSDTPFFTKDKWQINPTFGRDKLITEIEMSDTSYRTQMQRPSGN